VKQTLLKESLGWWVPEPVITLRRRGMFLVLVGARTSDDTKEKRNVPCPSQKLNHIINDKIIYFST
jgi:hypothetical protein